MLRILRWIKRGAKSVLSKLFPSLKQFYVLRRAEKRSRESFPQIEREVSRAYSSNFGRRLIEYHNVRTLHLTPEMHRVFKPYILRRITLNVNQVIHIQLPHRLLRCQANILLTNQAPHIRHFTAPQRLHKHRTLQSINSLRGKHRRFVGAPPEEFIK